MLCCQADPEQLRSPKRFYLATKHWWNSSSCDEVFGCKPFSLTQQHEEVFSKELFSPLLTTCHQWELLPNKGFSSIPIPRGCCPTRDFPLKVTPGATDTTPKHCRHCNTMHIPQHDTHANMATPTSPQAASPQSHTMASRSTTPNKQGGGRSNLTVMRTSLGGDGGVWWYRTTGYKCISV